MGFEQQQAPNMVTFKAVKVGKNKKNEDRYQFSLDQVNAAKLANLFSQMLSNPRGVKLDIQVAQREGPRGTFLSGYGFIKLIELFDPNATPQGGGYQQPYQQQPIQPAYAAPISPQPYTQPTAAPAPIVQAGAPAAQPVAIPEPVTQPSVQQTTAPVVQVPVTQPTTAPVVQVPVTPAQMAGTIEKIKGTVA